MQYVKHACGARPRNDEAPAGDAARDFRDQSKNDGARFRADGIARQAANAIEGEAYALAYVERLDRGTAQPGELAVLLSFLAGEMLHGACRVIEKALEGQRHA